jgi:hypothetical protein
MKPTRVRDVLVAAGLQAVICLAAAPLVAAGDAPRLGLTPVGQEGTFFDLTLEPGDHLQIEVEAANFGHERTRARTYAADVYSIVNGGFGAELRGQQSAEPTTWLSYPTQEITLKPQQALSVPFEVDVPFDTPPGQYITALVIESKEDLQSTGVLALNQVNRSAIAVAIDVPGPHEPRLSIGSLQHKTVAGHSILTFAVSNPGNVHLWPEGRLVLREKGGSRIVALAVVMDAVYAGKATVLETPLSWGLAPGEYCAELSLSDPATGAHDATACDAFYVAPAASGGGGDESENPPLLPGTDVLLIVTPVSFAIIAGAGLVGLAVILAIRRRTAAAETEAQSAQRAVNAYRAPK